MTGYEWITTEQGSAMYGKMTDNEIINTNGIEIINHGVYIAHIDANGDWTTPYLMCSADEFIIYE